ncbi:unnamed protein product [Prorocentrum cordatum]|uniref:Ion transport domain-containing protein n=1 Tax=Prorocentrum cordatum TaxID=2364126 RepID=A0ABN9T523_9DINO|nr:unnamed protein product [Polarella glacialis]
MFMHVFLLLTVGDLVLMQPFVDIPMFFVKNLLVLRLLRALRLFGRRRQVQDFLRTVARVVSAGFVVIWSYLVVLLMYAEVGLVLFGGVLRKSNPSLQGTQWFQSAYWSNNFNSLPSAIMVVFEQGIVNNWFVVADAVRQAVGPWADLFFVSYHIVSVSVLTNVFVAFLVEAWQRERQHLQAPEHAAATSAGDETPSRPQSPCLSPSQKVPARQTSVGSASAPEPFVSRLRTMTSADESMLPSTEAVMTDMFASDVRDIFRESHALNVARFKPRDYIREVPGLARLLRSDALGEAVLPRAPRPAPPLG